jgi:hypothetical protein
MRKDISLFYAEARQTERWIGTVQSLRALRFSSN